MKILVLSNLYPPDFLGGYEIACRQAVLGLREAGHQVLVLTGNPRSPMKDNAELDTGVLRHLRLTDIYDAFLSERSHHLVTRMRELEAYAVSANNMLVLAHTIQEHEPDVVYLHNVTGVGGLSLLYTVQAMNVPWVMHLGDKVPIDLCGIGRVVHPDAAKTFLRAINGRFICVSRTLMNEIADVGIELTPFSRFLPYWVITEGSPLRERFFRPGETLRIVNSGVLGNHKGTDIIIQTIAELRARGITNITVDLYGPGLDYDFRALALRLGVQDQIRFCGTRTQTELYNLYSDYDLFLFPTHAREPFGMAPMEAAAHGCLPLVSELCGYSEWFVNNIHCLKAPRSAQSFALAIERVLNGQVDLPTLARRSMAVTLRHFHIRAVLPAIEEELIQAVRRHSPGTRASVEDVYRLGILAEKSLQIMLQEVDTLPESAWNVTGNKQVPVREQPMDFNFYNETSTGLHRAPMSILQRIMRRIMRPMFHRLRDLLTWLHHQDLDQQAAITDLTTRLAQAEETIKKTEVQSKALELDHLAVVRRMATLEEQTLSPATPGDPLNGLYKLDPVPQLPQATTTDQRRAS